MFHARKLDLENRRAWLAVGMLSTVAATWLWAHEGHVALPSRGAQVDLEKGFLVLSRESREALDVQSVEVVNRPLPETLLAYATLVSPWQQHAFASSRLRGRIVELHVQAGQVVEAGQVLADVASLELENLQLEALAARNDVLLAEKILKGLEDSRGSVTQQSVLEARTALQQHRNSLEVARGKWSSLGLSRESLEGLLRDQRDQRVTSLPVRSPIGGTVIHADLNVGKVIETGEHLFEIVDLSKVWAKIGVLEKDINRVAIGQTVELRLSAYPGRAFSSTVQAEGLALDPQTHVNTVWAEFANLPGKSAILLPGMSGQVRIVMPARSDTRTVPAAALVNDGIDQYVLVEESRAAGASEFRKRSVEIVRATPEWVEVRSPDLFPGDRVVSQGGHELGSFFVPGVFKLSPTATRTIGLLVASVTSHVVEDVVQVDGQVDISPDRRSVVSAHLGGNVLRLLVDRGQAVKAGEILAEVTSLELQNLQLELLKEHLTFQLLDNEFQRLREAGNSVPRRKVLELESSRNASRNRRDNLRNRLEVVGLSPEQIDRLSTSKQLVEAVPVRAPIAGQVVDFDKVIGQSVRAEEPLLSVHDLSRPLVQGFVTERDIARVAVGQAARVYLVSDPKVAIKGRVVRAGRVFTAGDQTTSVWVELEERSGWKLRHGQLARVVLTSGTTPPVLAVPLGAVAREGMQAYVFVRKPDARFDRRAVRTGRTDDRHVEVVDGLQLGEVVGVQGATGLQTAFASIR